MGDSRGAVPCLLLPGLLEACSEPRRTVPWRAGSRGCRGEGSRAPWGRGSWRRPPRVGRASSGLPVPAEDQRDPEAECPSFGWQRSPVAEEARQQL